MHLSQFQLPKKGYEILILLQESPLASALEISKSFDPNLSPTTVIKAIQWLKDNNAFTSVGCELNYSALGLELIDVLVTPSSFQALLLLEKIIGLHPYTLYMARIFGSYDGLLCQFQIPMATQGILVETFDEFRKRGLIKQIEFIDRKPSVSAVTNVQLSYWNPKEFRWEFNGERWIKGFSEKNYIPTFVERSKIRISELDNFDIQLLVELTDDARRKNKEIAEAANITIPSQALSRRLKNLKENFIGRFRLFINYRFLDIYNTVMFSVKTTPDKVDRIVGYLQERNNNFPFDSTLIGGTNGFNWFVRAPSNVISYLSEFLWQNSQENRVSIVDYRSSKLWSLWLRTYDEETRNWKKSRKFLKDNLLKELDNYTDKTTNLRKKKVIESNE